jgi:phage-related protein
MKAATATRDFLVGIWNGIASFASRIWNKIRANVIIPLQNLYAGIKSVVSNIYQIVTSYFNKTQSNANSIWSRVYSTIKGWIDKVIAVVRSIKNAVTAPFSGAGSWLVDAGRRILQGLLDGINAMIGKVKGALNTVTGLIPDWKGPESTDKKLLTKNGRLIMQSLINGFDQERNNLRRYLQTLTSAIPTDVTMNVRQNAVAGKIATANQVAAASTVAAGPTVYNNWQVYNPLPEKTSTTTVREATRRANFGVLA